MDATKKLAKFEKDFFRDWIKRHPLLGTAMGLHADYDDRMPDGSLDKMLDDIKLLHRWLGAFERLNPKNLSPERAVDRDATIYLLKNWLFDREDLRLWERSPEAPQTIGLAIFQILSRNYSPLGHRMRSIMKRLDKMPKYVEQTRSRLRRPVKLLVEIELETITRLPGFFNLLKDIGREHLPVTPQRDLNRLLDQAQNVLQRYEDWLIVDVLPDCEESYALGDDCFRKLLRVRGVDAAPQRLAMAAESEISRLRDRQRETARSIKRKVLIEDVRDMIKQEHPDNFDGALRFVRDAVGKTRTFVTRSRFATLPDHEQLYVIETPSFLRHFQPFGTHWPPGKFESRQDGYFFVTPGDCDSDKLKEHNYPTLTCMTLREAYPGRHLQMSWAVRHPSPLRALGEFAPTGAGWGYYCEERAKEMGYDDTPQSRFMHLQASVFAAVRVLLDVRLASGKLNYEEAVEAVIDHLGTDRICAEAEARRYLASPGTPCVQHAGREQIRNLRKWAREKLGSRFTEAFFHNSLLQSGPLPANLAKRDLEIRIVAELKKPVEKLKEDPKKAHAAAKGSAKKGKAKPAEPAKKKKPAPKKKPKPASKKKAKTAKKKKPAPKKKKRKAPPKKKAKKRPAKKKKKPARKRLRR